MTKIKWGKGLDSDEGGAGIFLDFVGWEGLSVTVIWAETCLKRGASPTGVWGTRRVPGRGSSKYKDLKVKGSQDQGSRAGWAGHRCPRWGLVTLVGCGREFGFYSECDCSFWEFWSGEWHALSKSMENGLQGNKNKMSFVLSQGRPSLPAL